MASGVEKGHRRQRVFALVNDHVDTTNAGRLSNCACPHAIYTSQPPRICTSARASEGVEKRGVAPEAITDDRNAWLKPAAQHPASG